ncbi:hypothetical protein I7I53_10521 [Histoplasma capsulatum var. duboisii H88]|uniref:Uncharacterized protein n=1 Tax=Ajellomyces capsulatus (strain H88) TaxID=544711 RepID=A0A8A1LC04_AJEC8|nr:hypothetical protein I7I53_10521 [Histoplasma capsulatum var. duboisii H88]
MSTLFHSPDLTLVFLTQSPSRGSLDMCISLRCFLGLLKDIRHPTSSHLNHNSLSSSPPSYP